MAQDRDLVEERGREIEPLLIGIGPVALTVSGVGLRSVRPPVQESLGRRGVGRGEKPGIEGAGLEQRIVVDMIRWPRGHGRMRRQQQIGAPGDRTDGFAQRREQLDIRIEIKQRIEAAPSEQVKQNIGFERETQFGLRVAERHVRKRGPADIAAGDDFIEKIAIELGMGVILNREQDRADVRMESAHRARKDAKLRRIVMGPERDERDAAHFSPSASSIRWPTMRSAAWPSP